MINEIWYEPVLPTSDEHQMVEAAKLRIQDKPGQYSGPILRDALIGISIFAAMLGIVALFVVS